MSTLNEFDFRTLLAAKFTLREISNHEQKFYNLFNVAPMLSADIERMDALTKEHRALKVERDELLEALLMVRDADDDCKRDGLPTIPASARARIDAAIAKVTKEQA